MFFSVLVRGLICLLLLTLVACDEEQLRQCKDDGIRDVDECLARDLDVESNAASTEDDDAESPIDEVPADEVSGTVTLSGRVTYTSYLPTSAGLNYGAPTEKPIRGAVVELWDEDGGVLDSGRTSSAGDYSLSAPSQTRVSVVVKAALGAPDSLDTKIVDNTEQGALYVLTREIVTERQHLSLNFNASSGWDGESYSRTRAAAPFAILDTIYQAQQLVREVDANVVFPLLLVNWSKNNNPVLGDASVGDISTSYYSAQKVQLFVLGAENLDTDEYDSHVIAHEWGHYFSDQFSRSDSLGGAHGSGEKLDLTVAFSEGFSNAFSAMIMADTHYIDTSFNKQSRMAVGFDVDENYIDLNGFYSEDSVQEVIYDLYDSDPLDDDELSLGFAPIYDVLVGGHKNTRAFTSVFSFLHYLKLGNPQYSTAISNLASAEYIHSGDEYEELDWRLYTNVSLDGGAITYDGSGENLEVRRGNGFGAREFFKSEAARANCYTFTVNPLINSNLAFNLPRLWSLPSMQYTGTINNTFSGQESFSVYLEEDEVISFAVATSGDDTVFSINATVSDSPSMCE
ncbi:MAG: carboxypeptidase-like regulatory domain-containing protein [Gammaproteobacteria bacterium]|nr:carboxypeptidase-like regulatory domain-containing protein [Gammaproteobacteria bacterium]